LKIDLFCFFPFAEIFETHITKNTYAQNA
jgi:hypothetical protein